MYAPIFDVDRLHSSSLRPRHLATTPRRRSPHLRLSVLLLQFALTLMVVGADKNSSSSVEAQSTTQMPELTTLNPDLSTQQGKHAEKRKVLHTIRRVLENYSDDSIRKILGPTALPPTIVEDENELEPAEFMTTSMSSSSAMNDHKFHDELEAKLMEDDASSTTSVKPKTMGILRIRADIRSSSSSAQQNDEKPLNRHYRSARHDWLLQHHKRKRKACQPLHGRDQLLCPSRNTHRYDICILREQLCDHVVDCPGGEDEDVEQCFFYKPLDDQLKTLSHAVLLLVDNIMADSQQRRQEL